MHVRCPHCHSPIDVVDETSLANINCPACGSSFSLIGGDTTKTYCNTTRKLGQFELVRELGIGKFGSVWMARDTELDRTVAIKIPRKGVLDAEEAEKFLRDARAAAQLRHPNIVAVHEVGREEDTVYIVTDYIKGANLREWLTGQRLSFRESAELLVKVAEALHHAHQSGVVHRDLKPGNIMLDVDGQPHVIDFGLARRETGEVTMTVEGHILGTPAYMSPEQAAGKGHQADRRSDVYSLGVILFELLTGESPFRGEKQMLLLQIECDEPPRLRKLNARIPRDLETIALKCLQKDPGRRFQTAQELADDLKRWLHGEPIVARPVGRLERGWRWCRRNPVVAALSTGVVAVLLLGTFISTYFAIQASVRAKEAIAEKSRADKKAGEALAEKARTEREREKALASQKLEERQRERAEEAEGRATEDARRAGIEAEKAQQVARFLAAMFEESAPLEVGGLRFGITEKDRANANLTAREILDRGSDRVTAELQDQPTVQAALKDTMGNVYLGMGMIEKAEVLLQEAFELRKQHLPREHLDVSSSLHSIGMLRLAQNRPEESASALREALAIRGRLLGEDHKLADDSRMALATVLGLYRPGGEGEAAEALQLARATLTWRRSHFGNASPQTALAMLVVAGSSIGSNTAEAMKLVVDATPILLKEPATRFMGVAVTEMQKALIMERLGRRDAAVTAALAAMNAGREGLGDRHPLMTVGRGYGAGLLERCEKFDELERILQQSIQFDPNPLLGYIDMARLRAICPQEKYRNGTEAVEYATKACELTEYKEWFPLDTLAAAYAEQGNFDEAVRWQTKAIELLPKSQELHARLELYKSRKPHRGRLW